MFLFRNNFVRFCRMFDTRKISMKSLTPSLNLFTNVILFCRDRTSSWCSTFALLLRLTFPLQLSESNGISCRVAPSKCGGVAQTALIWSYAKREKQMKWSLSFAYTHKQHQSFGTWLMHVTLMNVRNNGKSILNNFTCDDMLDVDNHSANGFSEQSQDNGLSCKDKFSKSLAPINAFFATIDISFPSTRNSFSDGSGVTRSDVIALCNHKVN